MNEKQIFKKYLARYLLIILIVVFCCIPFGAVTYRYIRDYTISSNLNQLEENVKDGLAYISYRENVCQEADH